MLLVVLRSSKVRPNVVLYYIFMTTLESGKVWIGPSSNQAIAKHFKPENVWS